MSATVSGSGAGAGAGAGVGAGVGGGESPRLDSPALSEARSVDSIHATTNNTSGTTTGAINTTGGRTMSHNNSNRSHRKRTTTLHASFDAIPVHPLAAAHSLSAAALPLPKHPDRFSSNLKSSEPNSIAQYMEEARIAFQAGKIADALAIYSFIDGLKLAMPHMQVGFFLGHCRRITQQELSGIAAITIQIKTNEQNGINALGRKTGHPDANASGVPDQSGDSSTSSLGAAAGLNDPDHIAPSMVCEWERMLCWESLKEFDHVKRSSNALRRMMESTVPPHQQHEVDNSFACWMAMAKWLANQGYDAHARKALEKARDVLREDDPNIGVYVNSPHWLVLSAYISWNLGDYESVAALSSHFSLHSSTLLSSLPSFDDVSPLFDELHLRMSLLHIGSCLACADIGSPLSIETGIRMADEIIAHTTKYSTEAIATAYTLKANMLMLKGTLRQALICMKQAQTFESRLSESGLTPTRFPFYGPLAFSTSTSGGVAALPLASSISPYDLTRSMASWVSRGSKPAGLPPNFDIILASASNGFNPVFCASRYIALLLDFYSELLLKYGINDPRLLFYRSNLWCALGNSRMQLHDLDILHSTSPQWFAQYVAGQTACDYSDMQSAQCPAGRVVVVNLLTLHQVATSYGTNMLDKNAAASAANVIALQKKHYVYLTKIPLLASSGVGVGLSPIGHHRVVSSSPHDAEVASIGAHTQAQARIHQRGASSSSITSRASTAYSTVRPATVQAASGGNSIATEWDTIPVSGLLDCEDSLYYEAIIADLTRQHATSFTSTAMVNAMLNTAQESFEQILRQLHGPTQLTTPASPPAPSTVPPAIQTNTALICYEGLAIIHQYRLRFPLTRQTVLDGLSCVWHEVDRIVARKNERNRLQRAKLAAEAGRTEESQVVPPTPRPSLSASQILASSAPFHIKALKLSAPLLDALSEDPLFGDFDDPHNDHESDGTIYSEQSYWGSDHGGESKGNTSKPVIGPPHTTMEWLEPPRLLMTNLRRHCAILLAILGISYTLEANTDTSLLVLYRALAIDSTEYFANLYLFYHHFRFSPLNLCIKHYITIYETVPFFIPNIESIALSPLRYPIMFDAPFSGTFDDTSKTESYYSHNPFDTAPTVAPDQSKSRRSAVDATLAYPYPKCSHRCLTSRVMDRPYAHSSSPELTAYIQSLSSHVHAMKHRNEIALKLHRQQEIVEKYKTDHYLPGARKLDTDAIQTSALAASLSPDGGATSLILSLNSVHPLHPFHPFQQRQKKGMLIEEELRNMKPTKPAGTKGATNTARGKKEATAVKGAKKVADPKTIAFNMTDFALSKPLPPFIHVEHRPYQPNSGSSGWNAASWYKESLKLLSNYDKSGVLFAFLKCLHLDIDYCASLNYVLSLLETNLSDTNVTFATVQMMKDTKEIEALEEKIRGATGETTPGISTNGGVNKHTHESMAAMFGRDKVLPIVWDMFIRGKQYEEYYGNVELSYSEYSYVLMFMPLGDVLWRRGLIHQSRGNIPLALIDISEAIQSTLSDQSFLEKIPISANAPKKVVLQEIRPNMSAKEKAEVQAANAIAQNAHTPQASINIVKQKLEIYHLIRALIFYNLGNFSSSGVDAKECLVHNPRNSAGLRLLALCQTYLAQYEASNTALEKYLDGTPNDLGSRLRLANQYSFTGNHDKAMRQFDRILSFAPTNVEVLYGKGLAYYRQHMWHDAHEMFQQCISLQPKYWLAYMRQGEVLERLESYDLAIDTLKIALAGSQAAAAAAEEDTNEAQSEGYTRLESFHLDYIHRTMGRIYLSQAQQSYMGLLALLDDDRKSQAKRKKESHMRGDSDAADLKSTASMLNEPVRPISTASGNRNKELWNEALDSATAAVKIARIESAARDAAIRAGLMTSEDVLIAGLGQNANSKKNIQYVSRCLHAAFHSLQLAIQDTPGTADPESYFLLALTLLFLTGNRGRDPNGRICALLDHVISLQPRHVEARFLRGFLLQRDGRIDESVQEYDFVLQIDPEHVLALQARAYIYFMRDERQKSLETYTKMMNQPGPLRAVAYANRGLVHLVNRNFYAALNDLDYAISAAPHHALAYLYRAETHKALSFMNEAISDYRMAAPMLKQKLDDADIERKQVEARTGKRVFTASSSRPHRQTASNVSSSPFAFSGSRPATVGGADSKPGSTPSASLFAKEGEFGLPPRHPMGDTLAPPGSDANSTMSLSQPPISLAGQLSLTRSHTPQHIRDASTISLTLASPTNGASSNPNQSDQPPPPSKHTRISSLARWRGLRELMHRSLLRTSVSPTPLASVIPLSEGGLAPGSIGGTPILSPAIPLPTNSPVPPINTGERAQSAFEFDSLSFHPIQSGEHFRMVAHPLATSFQSEVGLTKRDLDSVHNSLGILLHQRAAEKKKAIIHAHGQKPISALESKQKHMTLALAAQLTMVRPSEMDSSTSSSDLAAPPAVGSTAVAAADAEDDEALSYFTGSSHFQAHYNRALVFLEKGSLHTALAEFRHAVEAAPDFANAHNNYAVVMEKMGQTEQAAQHYLQALKLTHNRHLIAGFNLANTKTSSNQYQDAIRLYTIFLKRVQKLQRDVDIESKSKTKKVSVGGGVGGAADRTGKPSQPSKSATLTSMRYESLHLAEETQPSGPESRSAFEQEIIEYNQRQLAAKQEKENKKSNVNKSGDQPKKDDGSSVLPTSSPAPLASHASQAHANLVALVPLALNNRAICFQNLGRNEEALAGYTAALTLAPKLTYIKFNRAHLYMVMGNGFDALEDIRDYSRDKAAKSFQLDQENRSTDARLAQADQNARNAIERDIIAPATNASNDTEETSHESMEYLSQFHDYCKRYQWGLAVATKDLLTGIKCMPIIANLNLAVPSNPLALFNPHMLHEYDSVDSIRLKELLQRLTPDELLRNEYEAAISDGVHQPELNRRAMLESTPADSACVAHVKLALRLQVQQKFTDCLDALLKALYLLPPSPIFVEQQKIDFARRHNLTVSGGGIKGDLPAEWTIDGPAVKGNGMDSALHAELISDLHEILILWRARLQVYLSRYDDAVSDLEFYVNALVASSDSFNKSIYRSKLDGRLRRNTAGIKLGVQSESEDTDNEAGEPHRSTHIQAQVGGQQPPQPTTPTRTQSRSDERQKSTNWNTSTGTGFTLAFRTAEEEQIEANQTALYAHRQALRHARVLCYLGSLYHMHRRDNDAMHVYTLAINLDKSNFYALLNRSLVSRLQGRYSNAIGDLFDVLKLISRLDEQQRLKDVARRAAGGVIATVDPLQVPSNKVWVPEIETGLPPATQIKLRLTDAQQAVHDVLLRYGEVLKLNPQESWDAITGLQGQLAIAVDSVLAERAVKKKQNVDVAAGGLKLLDSVLSSPADGADSDSDDVVDGSRPAKSQKLSAAEASTYLREQLDAATEKLMDHLIDPKAAREKEMMQTGGMLPPRPTPQHQPPHAFNALGKLQSTLALAESSVESLSPPATTTLLDSSFDAAFANMHQLILSQLPKKMLAKPPNPRIQGMQSPSAGVTTLAAAKAANTTNQPNTKNTFKVTTQPAGGNEPSFEFDAATMPLVAANVAAQVSGQPLPVSATIPVLADPRTPPVVSGPFSPSSQLSTLISTLHARAKSAAAGASSLVDSAADTNSTSSLASSRTSDKPTQPNTKKATAGGRTQRNKAASSIATKGAAAQRNRTVRAVATPVVPTPAAAHPDDSLLSGVDPSLSSADRDKLLDDRRRQKITDVKAKFAGHTRSSSFYGLLSETIKPSSSLSALASSQAKKLAKIELEEEEFSSLDDDDDD